MTILGYFILGAVGAFFWGLKSWSKFKRIACIVVTFLVCSFIFSDNDGGLKTAGQNYILQQLKNPSTATFLSYTSSDDVRDFLEKKWSIKLKDNCDAVIIEVESTNGFGGRVKDSFIVFFKDGKAIDMIDGDSDRDKVRMAVNYLGLI